MRTVVEAHVEELHDALRIVPQTNEVGRSAALLVGLFDLVRACGTERIRLLEVGASAGLNLLVDRFRFEADHWTYGPADSPVRLDDAIHGPVHPTRSRSAAGAAATCHRSTRPPSRGSCC